MKKISFLLFAAVQSSLLFSQGSALDGAIIKAVQFPNIAAPSPNVAAIERFGNIPVNYSTGIPDISIPIYTVKSGSLSTPIGLSYHAGGIRVDQSATNVGLGWSLNGQGSISITPVGRAGNPTTSTPDANSIVPSIDFAYLYDVGDGYADSEPDMYSYNFAGHSGKFIIKRDNTILLIPYTTLKITAISAGFRIVDENGTIYDFTKHETTNIDNSSLSNSVYTSAIYLTKILSASKTDSIEFTYGDLVGGHPLITNYYQHTHTIGSQRDPNAVACSGNPLEINRPNYSISTTLITSFQLDRIDFKGGHVDFLYTFDRSDYKGKGLTDIKVYDDRTGSPVLVKKFGLALSNFFYNPLSASTTDAHLYRLRLDSVKEYSVADNTTKDYSFEYNTTPVVPVGNNGQDYWGFNNGKFNNASLLETQTVAFSTGFGTSYTIGNADRSYQSDKVQGWMLQKITWPTGGKTAFTYESHKFNSGTGIEEGGGLRVKEIVSTDNLDNVLTKEEYKYGTAEDGVGVFVTPAWAYRQRFREVSFSTGTAICQCGTNISPNISRIYTQSSIYPISQVFGSPVLYDGVSKYNVDPATPSNNLKSAFEYDVLPDETFSQWSVNNLGVQILSNDWKNGMIKREAVYRNVGGARELVSEKLYTYGIQKTSTYNVLKATNAIAHSGCQNRNYNALSSYVTWYTYPINTGVRKLIQTTSKTYGLGSQLLVSTTDLEYTATSHDFITKSTTMDSKGVLNSRLFKYPIDFTAVGNVYEAMITRNIVSPVIESRYQVNSVDKYLTKNNYSFDWFLDKHLIALQNVETQKTGTSLESRLRYYKYDATGNPLEIAKENDVKTSFLWDFNDRLPVAQAVNSDQASIAYTSFEADSKGSWTYSGTPVAEVTAPTGNKVYATFGNIVKTGLDALKTYTVSYWKRNPVGIVSVNGSSSPTTGRTVNGWIYCEHTVANPASGQVTVSLSGGAKIDELRLYPVAAQMTTSTFEPLIGMTSQVDINNRVTYYEYDPFARLQVIKDQDKNVIKSFCYNYAGQAENCNVTINPLTITLSNQFAGAPPFPLNTTIEFLQNGVPVYTNTFPATATGTKTINLAPGNYQLRFTMPSGFSAFSTTYSTPDHFWDSPSGLIYTTEAFPITSNITIMASNAL